MKWLFFYSFILFCFGLGRGGILSSAFDWSYDEILEPFESECRFLFPIDATSRLLQLSWIPVFSSFFFPFGNVICISQSRSKEKEGCYDPIWDSQCFTAFFLTATLPIIDLTPAFGIKRTVRVSTAGPMQASLSLSLWSACVNGKVKNYANGMHTIQWLLTRFSFLFIFCHSNGNNLTCNDTWPYYCYYYCFKILILRKPTQFQGRPWVTDMVSMRLARRPQL